jgi:hypothetical protein
MKCGIVEDMKKAKVKPDEELVHAVESLERITNAIDEWVEQQKGRFEKTTAAFRKKWISDWFSDFYVLKFFKDKVTKKRFDDIVDTFSLYMPNIAESLREIWNNFMRSVQFMQKVEKDKDRAEKSHDLVFWCVNFFNTSATPTVERLRHTVKLARKNLDAQQWQTETFDRNPEEVLNRQDIRQDIEKLTKKCSATKKQAVTLKKRPEGVLNEQVGELMSSSPSDISASQIAGILNKNYVAEYEPLSPCAVGKTEHWKKHQKKNSHRKK